MGTSTSPATSFNICGAGTSKTLCSTIGFETCFWRICTFSTTTSNIHGAKKKNHTLLNYEHLSSKHLIHFPPHPHPFHLNRHPQLCHLTLSQPKLLHRARFHLLHTSSTTTFHCPPPRLPPALFHLTSAHENSQERDWRRRQCRSWRGSRSPTPPAGKAGGSWVTRGGLHLDTCQLEVFVLFLVSCWWWRVLARGQNQKSHWWSTPRNAPRRSTKSFPDAVVGVPEWRRAALSTFDPPSI